MFETTAATHWAGVYRYDPGIEVPLLNREVEFSMHLELRWFGRFVGRIVEGHGGIPEPAQIEGRFSGRRIHFGKRYASLWVADESGKTVSVPGQPSAVLHYDGQLSDDRSRIEGTWLLPHEQFIVDGQEWEWPETNGTWSAVAVNAQ